MLRSAGLWPVADGWSPAQPVGAYTAQDLVDMSPLALASRGGGVWAGYVAQALKAAVEDPTTLKRQLQQAAAQFAADRSAIPP